jgi:hypothetical protein
MAEKADKMEFFGEVDRDARGRIKSEFPAWYFESHMDSLKEEKNSLIRRMERGEIPLEHQPYARSEVSALEEKIKQIEKSRPDIRDNEKTALLKNFHELAEKISESMFTRSEMMMGTASANEEARRMVDPCIGLSPQLRSLGETMGVKVAQGGKVSRNGAIKMWKIIAKLIGEGSNVEALRKDKATSLTGA